jgi:hypothetical protein
MQNEPGSSSTPQGVLSLPPVLCQLNTVSPAILSPVPLPSPENPQFTNEANFPDLRIRRNSIQLSNLWRKPIAFQIGFVWLRSAPNRLRIGFALARIGFVLASTSAVRRGDSHHHAARDNQRSADQRSHRWALLEHNPPDHLSHHEEESDINPQQLPKIPIGRIHHDSVAKQNRCPCRKEQPSAAWNLRTQSFPHQRIATGFQNCGKQKYPQSSYFVHSLNCRSRPIKFT